MPRKILFLCLLAVLLLAGCASSRLNISYNASEGQITALDRPVTGTIIPLADTRENTRAYPKEVIAHTDYSGNVTYEINDKTVEEVFDDALAAELSRMGVRLVKVSGIDGPLDRETASEIAKKLRAEYPDVQVAFGGRIKDFMAKSQRTLIANDVHVTGWMQFYVLDVKTGNLLWSDYNTQWDEKLGTYDRDKMIERLNDALASLIHKSVRDNMSLRDLLVKISQR
ncbi:MAG: hypothetical protein ABSG42_06685 [Nitrospirota bacterium]